LASFLSDYFQLKKLKVVLISIAIDASRNRSGGAKAHLIGILSNLDPEKHGIDKIHIWSFKTLLDQLPDFPWLIKHNPKSLERSLFEQLLWQAFSLRAEVNAVKCDILFSTDASSLCRFSPMVVLSQDMLSYEPGVMQSYGYGFNRLRLELILILQNLAFHRASGVIFLTRYSGKVIQKSCGPIANVAYVPHGVDNIFANSLLSLQKWPEVIDEPIRCIYISNADRYKYQWNVVKAVYMLRARGYKMELTLVGGGSGYGQNLLNSTVANLDKNGSFVQQLEFTPHGLLPELISRSNIFIFASSCENMPVTLIEGMSMGLPIACSNRGPMPEILVNGGVYFDPEDESSIAISLEKIISTPSLRIQMSAVAKNLAREYSWTRCADETFKFITDTQEMIAK
jgi:glycosyltransferase involved in cell wall biosynthesis